MTELRWRYGAATDVGKVRDLNEDSHLASRRLLAVADGVGGAAAGEVASGVTIAEVTRLARRSPRTPTRSWARSWRPPATASAPPWPRTPSPRGWRRP
nr:hypothetical protein GCM10025732_17120 [Glycomyces mayteni]